MKEPPAFSPASRARLTDRDLDRFPGDTLFDRIARAVCRAGCLPRKELYEAWEMARRVRRLFRGGRVVDLGAGHGLLAQVMLLLDQIVCRELDIVHRARDELDAPGQHRPRRHQRQMQFLARWRQRLVGDDGAR